MALAGLALAGLACTRTSDAPALRHDAASVASVVDVGAITKAPPVADAPDDKGVASLASYASAAPVGGKSVGHTSVVFKLKLQAATSEAPLEAAYKPRSTRGGSRFAGEVAAYRLSRALSIDNVPAAMLRSFDYEALRAAVGREAIFAEVVKEPDGTVRGALMPWIRALDFLPLENDEWMPRWRAWLRAGGAIPDDQRALAAQISDMLAFDLVTANWDRWSGGNVGFDRAAVKLLFVDNDGAFFDPPPVKEMKRPTQLFEGVDRFSRGFIAALRAVDVARAIGDAAPGSPLLSAHAIAQIEARRRRVLAVVDAKIATLGEPAVLAFE